MSKIHTELGQGILEKLKAMPHMSLAPSLRSNASIEIARQAISEEFAKLEAERGLAQEITEASNDIQSAANETLTFRLNQAAQSHQQAVQSQQEDKIEYTTHKTGVRIRHDEKGEFDSLMDQIDFTKGKS